MGGDKLIEFEESNWDWLADKFIKIKQDDWDTFVYEEYEKSLGDAPEMFEREKR